jgi:hypothetical protein
MANRVIDMKVSEQYVFPTSRLGGVQGEGNITTVRLWFDSTWVGLTKTAVWLDAHGANPISVLLNSSNQTTVPNPRPDGFETSDAAGGIYSITIPHAPLRFPDKCWLQLRGTSSGSTALSVDVMLHVYPSVFANWQDNVNDCCNVELLEQILSELERLLGYEEDAHRWALMSESWAHDTVGMREYEETNNAQYWCEQAQIAAGGGGGGTVSEETLTDWLYANEGAIAQLVVNRLRTDYKKPWNYLDGNTDPVDYMDIYDERQDFITAETDGLQTEQYHTADGKPIWWLDGITGGKMTINEERGRPSGGGLAVPVMVYVYTPYIKWTHRFGLTPGSNYKMPYTEFGLGDPNGLTKARMYKDQTHFTIEYDSSNGQDTYWIKIGEDGITTNPPISGGGGGGGTGVYVIDHIPTTADLGIFPDSAVVFVRGAPL